MGASEFVTKARGKTAREAFNAAVEDARHEHGHNAYSGTIGTKRGFRMVALPQGEVARDYAWEHAGDFDKWGDCGCIDLGNGEWLFFGLAPS